MAFKFKKTVMVLFQRPMAGSETTWWGVQNFAWWESDPPFPSYDHPLLKNDKMNVKIFRTAHFFTVWKSYIWLKFNQIKISFLQSPFWTWINVKVRFWNRVGLVSGKRKNHLAVTNFSKINLRSWKYSGKTRLLEKFQNRSSHKVMGVWRKVEIWITAGGPFK